MISFVLTLTARGIEPRLKAYYSEKTGGFETKLYATHYGTREEAESVAVLVASKIPIAAGRIEIEEDDTMNAFF